MSKEIKDYLHLYVGCDCICDNGVIVIRKITPELLVKESNGFVELKPILRDLSDMTKEEDEEFRKVNRDNWIDMHWYPEGFTWLISKGFDLFELIPAGLAINAKDLKQ